MATDDEKSARDRVTHEAWGARLSVDAYAARERALRAHPWAEANMTTWFWRQPSGEVLASLETFRMDARVGTRAGAAWGVASVFVERRLRGHRYATALLDAVLARLRETEPDALASLLFSDVGAPIYARSGYHLVPAGWVDFPAAPGALPGPLHRDDLPAAVGRIVPVGEVVVIPSAPQLDWHLHRERFYARALDRRSPAACGLLTDEAFALWTADFKNERLDVLVWSGELELVLGGARAAAHEAELPLARLWTDRTTPELPPGGTVTPREHTLPMLAPLDPVVDPSRWRQVPRGLWV